MTLAPVWFLDVDGVLCPLGDLPGGGVHDRHPHAHGNSPAATGVAGMWVCWTPAVVERIAALHTRGAVQVVWLTSWEESAALLPAVLGLPEFAVLTRESVPLSARGRGGWWKAEVVCEYLASTSGRAFVWTDDDLTRSRKTRASQALAEHDGLLIAPQRSVGLTARHLSRIEAFAKQHAGVLG